ncbi:hypothetical protein RB653_003119 [Dictyostelium firmibasis]|uniref:Uncharacterized protein n=1 Tax=Dictyostelium firmibasis TaxID=79012 RepID=A0AAN7YTB6_9MYCE
MQRTLSKVILNSGKNNLLRSTGSLLNSSFLKATTNVIGIKQVNNNSVNSIVSFNDLNKRYFTSNPPKVEEEDDEVAPDEAIKVQEKIEESEKVIGLSENLSFQTETQKILQIVAQSLYTEKEVFIRELISNASDAIEKVRHTQLTNASSIEDSSIPFEIKISTDDEKKTLIIQDSGIGMTRDEMIKNLGKIGYSGSGDFIKNLGENPDKASIIGQFGVGFYSCFMVGHTVKIYTKSALPGSKGYLWESHGTGNYSITEAEGVSRGTKIIIHLKPSSFEYSKMTVVENIIKKYSNFVGFPILLNGSTVNTIRPLWTLNKNSITDDEHKEFYQFLSKSYDTPSYKISFSADTPLSIRSLFYIPSQHMEKYGMGKMEPGVSLFSRKVLIQQKAKGILPEWMRFVRGVVDSEDIPLNVSREHLQDNGLIQRLSSVLVKRILRHLKEESTKDPIKFNKFMEEFGGFFKEGVITDFNWKDEIAKLLRFESSYKDSSSTGVVSLDEYVARMKPNQNEIYFLSAPNRSVAESSPYYEPFQLKNIEVIFLFNSVDEFVLSNIGYFGEKRIVSVESKEAEEFLNLNQEKRSETLSEDEINKFLSWVDTTASDKVSQSKTTNRSISSPAIIIDHESASFRRMLKMMEPGKHQDLPKQIVEFNMSHPIILKLIQQIETNPTVAKLVIDQVIDNAFISAGLIEDNRQMVPRINQLLESLLSR